MKLIDELCQNHNGKMPVLKKMVELAAKSGDDICKIQSIKSRDLIYWKEFEDFRPYEKEYERLKSLYIQDNHISMIAPGTFIALTHLNDLDLSKSRISKLTRNTFSGLKMIQVV